MTGDRSEQTPPNRSRLCPSATETWPDAQLIGVVGGSVEAPRVTYVAPRPVTPDLLALAQPATPGEVFRFAATCREQGCQHWQGRHCGVAAAAVAALQDEPDATLPRCAIRRDCRWWAERGPSACRRCASVVTVDPARPRRFEAALRG